MTRTRILILGGGVAGLSTAWWLAERGVREVTLVEREPTFGAHSSGKSAAILRSAMAEREIRALALEGSRFLRHPPSGFARHALVEACGVLLAAEARASEDLASWARALEGELEIRELDRRELRSLAPALRGEIARAFFVPQEGRIDTAELLASFERGARARGVELRTRAEVRALSLDGPRVRGATLADGTQLEAERVVVANGGWAGKLAHAVGSPLEFRPTKRHLLVTESDARVDPRGPIVWVLGGDFYARPESGGWMLCACDESAVDPDLLLPDPQARERIAEKALRYLPEFADARPAHLWCGMRTFTADRAFAIGPDPKIEGLYWVAGLGGHGFTTASAVGRLAAEWIDRGGSSDPLARHFAPARLAAAPR